MTRRVAVALAGLALAAGCASPSGGTASPSSATSSPSGDDAVNPTPTATTSGRPVHCGYVRWAVKTGADPLASAINLRPARTTISALRATRPPFPPPTSKYPPNYRRFPAEERTVTVGATIIAYNIQQDGDFHLVLMDASGASIIAEIPNPACVKGGPLLAGIQKARAAFVAKTHYNAPQPAPGRYSPPFVTASLPVRVTGVVFYDFVHGQHGVAPNGVELHPVLALAFK